MITYIYTETDSPKRGFNKRITVYRMRNGRPEAIGHSDSHTAAWHGADLEAKLIIEARERNANRSQFLDCASKHTTHTGPGRRVFGV